MRSCGHALLMSLMLGDEPGRGDDPAAAQQRIEHVLDRDQPVAVDQETR